MSGKNEQQTSHQPSSLFWSVVWLEGGLVVLALVLAYFGLYDHQQPLRGLAWAGFATYFFWGVIFTIPLLLVLGLMHYTSFNWVLDLRRFAISEIRPLFAGLSVGQLAIIAIMAGLGEELLFRWSIQGGITTILEPRAGLLTAQLIGLLVASILFALCHALSTAYIVLTLLVGIFLGWVMIYTGSWIVPALSHALYDFVALLYLVNFSGSVDGLSTNGQPLD